MPTPVSYNLVTFARDIVNAGNTTAGYGSARLLFNGDSFISYDNLGRMIEGIRDTWRPYRWSGWYLTSSHAAQNISASPGVPNYTTTVTQSVPAGMGTNRFDFASALTDTDGVAYAIGDIHNNFAATPDTTNGLAGTAGTMLNLCPAINSRVLGLKVSPHAYREMFFTAGIANSTQLFAFTMDMRTWNRFNSTLEPALTATTYGNWLSKGDVVTARLIYYQSLDGPSSLIWRTTRGGTTNNSTTFNANGAAAVTFVDADFTAASASLEADRAEARLLTDALGTTESAGGTGANTLLPMIGTRYFRPNTTGLELSHWSQPGWNLTMFSDPTTYDSIDNTSLGQWLTALGWPTHLMIMLGQNQSSAETTELNAGTSTQFKTDYKAHIDRIMARYDAAAVARPKVLLLAPWILQYDYVVTTSSRTVLNYTTMATAIYELCQERGYSFVDMQQLQQTPEDFTDLQTQASRLRGQILWSSDDVHQGSSGAGSLYMAGCLWSQMTGSVNASSGLSGDSQAIQLRGRGG